MRGLHLAALLVGLPFALSAADSRPSPVPLPEEPEASDVQDILFLGDERPVIIRFHLLMDGRSFRSRWEEFARKMFAEIDHNGDGQLAGDELSKVPSPDLLLQGNARGAPQGAQSVRANVDTDPADGRITLEEFLAYVARVGGNPLSLQAGGGSNRGGPYAQPGIDAQAGELLFTRLDADGDGKLTKEELTRAEDSLKKFDIDEDGTWSAAELQPNRNPFIYYAPQQANPAPPAQFLSLSAYESPDTPARRMLDRYDRRGEPKPGEKTQAVGNDRLDITEFTLAPEDFARADADGDKELNFDELVAWLRRPVPDVEITIRIGTRENNRPAVEVHDTPAPHAKVEVRKSPSGDVLLVVAGTQVEFASASAGQQSFRDFFLQQFKAADGDNNNYLEKKEVQRNFYFNQTFDAMDADDDGKLFEKEVVAYLEQREAAARSRTLMSVADSGRNLFEILDANRDGRVGVRELRAALAALTAWDADRDGALESREIPIHCRVSFGRAQPNIPGAENLAFAFPQAVRPQQVPRTGPAWFQKMDRNRDGDLSWREFLGTREAFDKLDRNRDGLIDAEEAAQK